MPHPASNIKCTLRSYVSRRRERTDRLLQVSSPCLPVMRWRTVQGYPVCQVFNES